MVKHTVLLSGRLDYGPIGRHFQSFINYLLNETDDDIYIDKYYIDMYRYEPLGTSKLEQSFLQNERVKYADKDITYDFAVFTDLLTLSYEPIYKEFLTYKCRIRVCYEVFDGSIPPKDWISVINDNFDLCLSPSVYISSCLHQNGVNIPCFNLPCAIFNDEILKMEPSNSGNVYRFGFIGGNEERKNVHKVIEAFGACFKNHDDVELYIHSAYSAEPEYAKRTQELVDLYSKDCKIHYNFNSPITDKEIYNLISTFNFYIYPSKTTGYFTTPAEALSLGIPVIITDIPVHQELVRDLNQDDGIYLIKADMTDLMQHKYLGNKYLGVQYDCSTEEISKQLLKAYENRKNVFTLEKIMKRKDTGRKYGLSGVAPLFSSIFKPQNFGITKTNNSNFVYGGIDSEGILYGSEKLYKKYLSVFEELKLTDKKQPQGFEYYLNKESETKIIEKISKNLEEQRSNSLEKGKILHSKYMQKLLYRAEKSNVNKLPKFVYKMFSLYCKTKSLLTPPHFKRDHRSPRSND